MVGPVDDSSGEKKFQRFDFWGSSQYPECSIEAVEKKLQDTLLHLGVQPSGTSGSVQENMAWLLTLQGKVFGHNREEDYASELEDAAHKLSNLADEARNKQSFGGSFGDFFKRTKFARITPAPSQAAAEQASQADAEQGAVEESTAINPPAPELTGNHVKIFSFCDANDEAQ